MNTNKKGLKIIALGVILAAKTGANNACLGAMYQPKVPEKLRKISKTSNK